MPWKRHEFQFVVGIEFEFLSQTAPISNFLRFGIHFFGNLIGFYEKSNRRGVKQRPQDMVENSG